MARRGFIRCLLLGGLSLKLCSLPGAQADQPREQRNGTPRRVLHVMSYEAGFNWSEDQFSGFRLGLGRDQAIEYKVFELDAKRNESATAIAARVRQARQIIDEWKPDLLYVSDDAAVEHLFHYYANTNLPCVFSGMNRSLAYYKLEHARNVTGTLEQEHFVETIRLLQQIKPDAKRIHLLSDQASYWTDSIQRIEMLARRTGGMSLVGSDRIERYADFQRVVLDNPRKADAYLLLGVFNYKSAEGHDVPFVEVQRWIAEHSLVPDVSFWTDRIRHGTLAGVTVSGLDQGRKAGLAARQILFEGRSPASLPVEVTQKGIAAINLSRARALGITPRSSVLLTSQVSTDYEWAQR